MFFKVLENLPYNIPYDTGAERWQRKKPYLSVRHVDFNPQDGWENVPHVTNGKAWWNLLLIRSNF